MTLKRGYSLKERGIAHLEASDLEGYPSWDGWKHIVASQLSGNNIPRGLEEPLHRFYILRRKVQMGKAGRDEEKEFSDWLDQNHPDIFDNQQFNQALTVIREKTTRVRKGY